MSSETRLFHISEEELGEFHDMIRSLYASFGLIEAALDRATAGSLHFVLCELETSRRCKQEIRERLSVVK
jgi:hypothetical protein